MDGLNSRSSAWMSGSASPLSRVEGAEASALDTSSSAFFSLFKTKVSEINVLYP